MLKLDKSKEINDEQSENILNIVLTFDELKLDKSKEINFEQTLNI